MSGLNWTTITAAITELITHRRYGNASSTNCTPTTRHAYNYNQFLRFTHWRERLAGIYSSCFLSVQSFIITQLFSSSYSHHGPLVDISYDVLHSGLTIFLFPKSFYPVVASVFLHFTSEVILGELNDELDSLRWFSQRRSRTPHFGGAHPGGPWPPNSNSAEIFVQCSYCPSFIILCLLVQKLSCWQTNKQTNRRRWKHPTFFATLRRRVITYKIAF